MSATQARPPESSEVFPFVDMIPTPLEVLGLYDEDICTGVVKIHDWQKEVLRSLGKRRSAPDEAVRVMLLAANGSGKSQFILAPFAVWVCLAFTNSLTVVTTASGDQMDKQARRYITRLCTEVNRQHREHFGFDIFDCQVRRVTNVLTKSYIDMFATDDPGRAEGHHRLKHDGEFALIIDEAKTVADEIFKALAARCKDYTRRLDVTSPGDCSGYFYDT